MEKLLARIRELQRLLRRHGKKGLKEYPTRTIFIDPLLEALGWDVRDPDEVELEYPTVDNKSVDYALKLNRKPVLLLEAKPLGDNLDDVKSITQVVGYAANDAIDWCLLTNGVEYRVYRTREPVPAPDKLLFECSIAPQESEGKSPDDTMRQFWRFSKEEMARGTLDSIGEQVFTDGKVRKALDKLFEDPPASLLKQVRQRAGDDRLKPRHIAASLRRIWLSEPPAPPEPAPPAEELTPGQKAARTRAEAEKRGGYGEEHHTRGKPQEIVELYRALDQFCLGLDPGNIVRRFRKYRISYASPRRVFCMIDLRRMRVRARLRLRHHDVEDAPGFARDITNLKYWGELELKIDTRDKVPVAQALIEQSYRRCR